MFYGRSVSGRYGLGAPFCSFTQQDPKTQEPKAKRPTSPVPTGRQAGGVGGKGGRGQGGVRSGVEGTSRLWGSTVNPHTAIPAVAASSPTSRKTLVKSIHLLSPVFVGHRGCRHLDVLSNSFHAAKTNTIPFLLGSHSLLLHIPQPPSSSHVESLEKQKNHIRFDVAFRPSGDLIGHLAARCCTRVRLLNCIQ